MTHFRFMTLLLIALSLFCVGCSSIQPYLYKSYELNDTLSVPVGSSLFNYREGFQEVTLTSDKRIVSGSGQELIYTGVVGNTLKLFYREYYESSTGSYARSPFFLELQYDLAQDKTIVFREYLIEVLSADQRAITFAIRKEPKSLSTSYQSKKSPTSDNNQSSSGYSSSGVPLLKLKTSTEEIACILVSEDVSSVLVQNLGSQTTKRYSKSEIEYIHMPDGTIRHFSK